MRHLVLSAKNTLRWPALGALMQLTDSGNPPTPNTRAHTHTDTQIYTVYVHTHTHTSRAYFRPGLVCGVACWTWCKILVNQRYECRPRNPPTQEGMWAHYGSSQHVWYSNLNSDFVFSIPFSTQRHNVPSSKIKDQEPGGRISSFIGKVNVGL